MIINNEYLLFFAGIILLIKGAGWLIAGASDMGKKWGLSSFMVGMTIVAFGTSLPELIISIMSILKGSEGIILGNIIGSNISNLLLILGISGMIYPIRLSKEVLRKDLVFSIYATILLLLITVTLGVINRLMGVIFILLFLIFFYSRTKYSKGKEFDVGRKYGTIELKMILLLILGSISLYLGGEFIVDSVITISQTLNLSDFVISATAIAIGTSLPELTTSLKALKHNKKGMAVGNIIGSNIFNILWVLGLTSIIKPINLPQNLTIDIGFLLFGSMIFFLSMFVWKKYQITKRKAMIFLAVYFTYILFIILRG